MLEKRPLIIDCDPGVDDAQCIMMVKGSGLFDIRGITPVHGNVPLEKTKANALFLNHYYGIDAPVAVGAEEAMIARLERAEMAHGKSGLGSFEYSLDGLEYSDMKAWDFIWEEAQKWKGELELLAIGPLTNIAILVLKHPEVVDLVKRFVIMGGGATKGNHTQLGEFNIWQDPHAAEIVFKAGFKDFYMVDLDACATAYLTLSDQDEVLEHAKKTSIGALFENFAEFRKEMMKYRKMPAELIKYFLEHYSPPDAAAAAVIIDPSICEYVDKYVTVDCNGVLTAGQTVVDWFGFTGSPNMHVVRRLDRERYVKLYLDCLDSYREVQ